jgi:hypothetical protein
LLSRNDTEPHKLLRATPILEVPKNVAENKIFKLPFNYRQVFPYYLAQLSHEMDLNFLSDSFFTNLNVDFIRNRSDSLLVRQGQSQICVFIKIACVWFA